MRDVHAPHFVKSSLMSRQRHYKSQINQTLRKRVRWKEIEGVCATSIDDDHHFYAKQVKLSRLFILTQSSWNVIDLWDAMICSVYQWNNFLWP